MRAAVGGDVKSLDKAIEDWDRKKGISTATKRAWSWAPVAVPGETVEISQPDLQELIRSGVAKDGDIVQHPTVNNGKQLKIVQLKKIPPFDKFAGVTGWLRGWTIDKPWIDKCQDNITKCIAQLKGRAGDPAAKCNQYIKYISNLAKSGGPGCKQLIRNYGKWKATVAAACGGKDSAQAQKVTTLHTDCVETQKLDPCQKTCDDIEATGNTAVSAAAGAQGDNKPCKNFMMLFRRQHKADVQRCKCTNAQKIGAIVRNCDAAAKVAQQEEVSLNEQRLNKLAAKVRKKLLNE
jgi:hypothetical protein